MTPVLPYAAMTNLLNLLRYDLNFFGLAGAGTALALFKSDIVPNPVTDWTLVEESDFSGVYTISSLGPTTPLILPDGRQALQLLVGNALFCNAEPDPPQTAYGYVVYGPSGGFSSPFFARRFDRPVPVHNGTIIVVEPVLFIFPTDCLAADPLPTV